MTLLFGACSRTGAPPDGTVLATVAGHPITSTMLQDEMVRRGGGDPGRFADPAAKQALLEAMIQDRVLRERARAAGYDRDPQVTAAFERAMVGRFREDDLERKLAGVQVSADEVQAEYQARLADFSTPALSRAAILRIAVPAGVSAAKRETLREKARALHTEAASIPADTRGFGALAARHSDDRASRYRGGDIGWIREDQPSPRWPAPVVQALLALTAPGDLAPLVEAPDGFYLVKLIEKRPAQVRPLSEVEERLRPLVLRRKQQALEHTWLTGLRKSTPVEIDQAAVDAVAPPQPPAPTQGASPPELPAD